MHPNAKNVIHIVFDLSNNSKVSFYCQLKHYITNAFIENTMQLRCNNKLAAKTALIICMDLQIVLWRVHKAKYTFKRDCLIFTEWKLRLEYNKIYEKTK